MKRFWLYGLLAVLSIGLAVMVILYLDARTMRTELLTENAELKRTVAATNESIYHALNNDLNDIGTGLHKLDAVATPQQYTKILADVWRLSSAAEDALSRLPAAQGDAMGLHQFLIRSGDYCYQLMDSVQNGRMLKAEELEQLHSMRTRCMELCDSLQAVMDSGEWPTQSVSDEGFYAQNEEEESIANYPTLLYDGPFSESSEQREVLGLPDDTVTEAQAREIASTAFSDIEWQSDGRCEGMIATFDFSAVTDRGEASLSVTERGGKILYYMQQTSGGRNDPPSDAESEELHRIAEEFLSKQGYEEMHPSYAQYYSGTVVLNYAATQDGVVLYADLIKVTVDRDSKQVVGMDARNYLFSHRTRELAQPTLTEEDAKNAVSANLKIASVVLALIPKSNTREVLCYECKGTVGDAYYIVYINAQSGAEEEIYEVINSEEGDLVV